MIDASKAIEHLDLRGPVEFIFTDLNAGDPFLSSILMGGVMNGQTKPEEDGHHEITLDLDAIHYDACDVRAIVAHELWHCKQFEDTGDYRKAMARISMVNSAYSYLDNPDELAAEAHVAELKELITISDCGGSGPTRDETQDVLDRLEHVLMLGDIDSELEYDDPVYDEDESYDDDFEDA